MEYKTPKPAIDAITSNPPMQGGAEWRYLDEGAKPTRKPKAGLRCKYTRECVMAWWEPRRADGTDGRDVRVSANPIPSVGWSIRAEVEGVLVADMVLHKSGRWYAIKCCKALVLAIGKQANHARRNRQNRKVRKQIEAEIAATVARQKGEE